MTTRYNNDRSLKARQFLTDVVMLMKRYDLCISHEDEHGSFIVKPFDSRYAEWFREAAEYD